MHTLIALELKRRPSAHERRDLSDPVASLPTMTTDVDTSWGRILDTGQRLRTLLKRFEEDHDRPGARGRAPLIPATVRENGDVVIDGEVSWPGLASGADWYLYHYGRTLALMRPRESLRR